MRASLVRRIRRWAGTGSRRLSRRTRDKLQEALFDPDAHVRRLAAEALFFAGSRDSAAHLNRLAGSEEDPDIALTAEVARRRCRPPGWEPLCDGARRVTRRPELILYAGQDLQLARALQRWCAAHGNELSFARAGSSAVIAVATVCLIIDPDYLGQDMWQAYCNFCAEVAEPLPAEDRKEWPDAEGAPPEREGTPVVLLDPPGGISKRAGTPLPVHKAEEGRLLRAPKHNPTHVLEALYRLLEDWRHPPAGFL